MQSLGDLLQAVRSWRARLGAIAPPPLLAHRASPIGAVEALFNIERRINEGNLAPVRVALFGPTGAGKSKLFNSLIHEVLSPASFRRPYTRRPVYYLHERHSRIAKSLRGDVRFHSRADWQDLILIDAPDFDSVEAENRAIAAQIYLEADAFIFVADVHKYADASTWTYLHRIRAEGKPCAFVLNKIAGAAAVKAGTAAGAGSADGNGASPLDDFRSRLEDAFRPADLPGPLIAIGDRPQSDEELLAEGEPGLDGLRSALERFRAPPAGGPGLLADSFRIDLRRFIAEWDRLSAPLRAWRAGVDRILSAIDAAYEREADGLRRDLQAEVDPALKSEVYREVLRRIERIDVLRYPRRVLALPALGVRALLVKVWPKLRGAAAGETERPVDVRNLAVLEGRLRAFSDEVRGLARAETACPGALDDAAWRALRLDHAAIPARYARILGEFRSWAESQARTAASQLTAEHKVKFILSQVIYNTVVIGVQVKTAGTLTLTEMFTDGILSPLVAKAVGMAVSSERVKQFEEEARAEFARRLAEVLAEQRDRFAASLAASAKGVEDADRLAPEVEGLRAAVDGLADRFAKGTG